MNILDQLEPGYFAGDFIGFPSFEDDLDAPVALEIVTIFDGSDDE